MKRMKKMVSLLVMLFVIATTVICPTASATTLTDMTINYAGNGVFNIEGTLPSADGDYKLIVAKYDADGCLIDAGLQSVTAVSGAFSTTVEFSSIQEQVRFFLWEMSNLTPCANVAAIPDEGGYNIITTKTEVGTSTGGNQDPLTNLVDGKDNTFASFYGGTGKGAMYVDLEKGYEIDRIEVLAYNSLLYERGSGFDIVLGNDLPDDTAFVEGNGEFKVGTVAVDTNATSATVGYKTFYVPDNAGSYRYVSFETFDETDGLSVAEVKVYVKSLGEQIVYESVTNNATSHKSSATATATNYETDPKNQLVDGKTSTMYGTGPAVDAYFTFIDLGEGGRRVDKVVITTNDPANGSRVIGQKYYLANTVPVNGADRSGWVYLGTRTNNAVPMTFILTEQQAGTYRYVVADCTDSTVGGYVNEIEVYKDASYVEPVIAKNVAKGKSVTPSVAGMTGYANPAVITDGTLFATNATNQFIITTRPSLVCIDLAGSYSVSKVVIDAVTTSFTKDVEAYVSDTPSSGVNIPASATKILEGNSAGWDNSIKTVELETPVPGRYVIIKMTTAASGSFRLSEVEVWGVPSTAPAYVSVTNNATSHKSSATATATSYETDSNNYLVDGNPSTMYGTGPAAGAYFTFIDLGEGGKRVDKVVITTNDPTNGDRVIGQKYYLANTVPVKGADRSGWVYLGTRTENGTAMTFILTEQQAGTYRYVVADCTDSTVGGYVNEIEVYSSAN